MTICCPLLRMESETVVTTSKNAFPFWSFRSIRLRMVFLMSAAYIVDVWTRTNLGMAQVCMVRKPKSENVTMAVSDYNTDLQVEWNAQEMSIMHASLFAGLLLPVFFVQYLTAKFGPKQLIALGLLVSALGTFLVPVVIYLAPHFLIVVFLRFAIGISQGFFIPCVSYMLAVWFPASEKSVSMAILTMGNQIGTSLSMVTTAELCKLPFLGGWPNSFFLQSLIAIVGFLIWQKYVASTPQESGSITHRELAHITGSEQGCSEKRSISEAKTPYLKILLSPVGISLFLCSFAQAFLITSITCYLPLFYSVVLGLSLTSNGLWSSLPFLTQLLSKFAMAFAADGMKNRGFDVNLVAKLFNGIASFGGALALLGMALGSNSAVIILCLCLCLNCVSGYVPGYNTSIVSVAPIFTAAVSGYVQFASQMSSTLAPLVIGHMTKGSGQHHSSASLSEGWPAVFCILAGILLASGLFFQFFGSSKVQPWATDKNGNRNSQNGFNGTQSGGICIIPAQISMTFPNVDELSNFDMFFGIFYIDPTKGHEFYPQYETNQRIIGVKLK